MDFVVARRSIARKPRELRGHRFANAARPAGIAPGKQL
jgi:hypothetical protein